MIYERLYYIVRPRVVADTTFRSIIIITRTHQSPRAEYVHTYIMIIYYIVMYILYDCSYYRINVAFFRCDLSFSLVMFFRQINTMTMTMGRLSVRFIFIYFTLRVIWRARCVANNIGTRAVKKLRAKII